MSKTVQLQFVKIKESLNTLQSELDKVKAAQTQGHGGDRQLKADLDDAQTEIVKLKSDYNDAQSEIYKLTTALDSAQAEIRQLKGDHNAARDEISQLKTDLDKAQDDIRHLKTHRDDARADIRSLQTGQGGAQQADDSQWKAELDSAKSKIYDLQVHKIEAGEDMEKLRKQQKETKDEAEKLNVQLPYLNRHVKDFFQDLQTAAEKQLRELGGEECPLRFEVPLEDKAKPVPPKAEHKSRCSAT